MKLFLTIITFITFYSCSPVNRLERKYYYVDALKEQDVILIFNKDSTFTATDSLGCNTMSLNGRYKMDSISNRPYFTFTNITYQQKPSSENSFGLNFGDTAWLINSERLAIKGQPFVFFTSQRPDLKKIRVKALRDFYVATLGKKDFIRVFGEGKNEKKAKENLSNCYGKHGSWTK